MRAYIGNLSIKMKLMISFFLIATIPTMMIFYNVYNISITIVKTRQIMISIC